MRFLLAFAILLIGACSETTNDSINDGTGIECQTKADCNDHVEDALEPDKVDCRYLESDGSNRCAECFTNEECPSYHSCVDGGYFCRFNHRLVNTSCKVNSDCDAVIDTGYFEIEDQVSCEGVDGAKRCVQCDKDSDCPNDYLCMDDRFPNMPPHTCVLPAGS